jgi:hypothetical protein
MTAKAGVDYYERSNSDDDVVIFEAGEKTQECSVAIVDDSFYEGDEKFRLVLEQPQFQHGVGRSLIGSRSETIIRIVDNNDRMLNKFIFISFSWICIALIHREMRVMHPLAYNHIFLYRIFAQAFFYNPAKQFVMAKTIYRKPIGLYLEVLTIHDHIGTRWKKNITELNLGVLLPTRLILFLNKKTNCSKRIFFTIRVRDWIRTEKTFRQRTI